ncbi:DUF6588 family protein [Marinoscillum sp.]|uniref:DUF6588 family protein n=1 Tax=Marinoscillum sp. TaxID=2024838 RepID=UPI003BAB7A41
MKLKFTFLSFLITVLLNTTLNGQNFGDILAVGADNAETYLENYAAPGINAFGNGLSNGWYNTAKPHKSLGFNLTISPSFAFIPSSERSFEFNPADYQDLTLEGDQDGIIPTLAGGDAEPGSELVFTGQATYPGGITFDGEQRFDVPDGVINLKDVPLEGTPAPTYNIGIGIIKGTEVKIRILPEVTAGDFKASMFGFGVQHDIKQWIPGISKLPFDLSALVAYSKLNLEYGIDVNTGNFEGNGAAIFSTSATTVQGIISKKLLFFTPFLGIGFNAVNSQLDVNGTYRYNTTTGSSSEIEDPISLSFDGAGSARTTIGGRINLAILTIHAAYTLQRYNTFNMGIGISVR